MSLFLIFLNKFILVDPCTKKRVNLSNTQSEMNKILWLFLNAFRFNNKNLSCSIQTFYHLSVANFVSKGGICYLSAWWLIWTFIEKYVKILKLGLLIFIQIFKMAKSFIPCARKWMYIFILFYYNFWWRYTLNLEEIFY